MFASLIVMALCGQTPAPSVMAPARALESPDPFAPGPDPFMQALEREREQARAKARYTPTTDDRLIARRKARKSAAYAARLRREAAEAKAAAKAEAQARKDAKEMAPYLLEAQRQALQRQTDIERNRILDRMAGAAERQAGYVYPGQSPTTGPYR